jgi:hypothetical protein
MIDQVAKSFEGSRTNVALEWSLSGMGTHVNLQVALFQKYFLAAIKGTNVLTQT